MDRSFVDRSLIGRLNRPRPPAAPRRVDRSGRTAGARSNPRSVDRPAGLRRPKIGRRPWALIAGLTHDGGLFVWSRRRLRIALLSVVVALPLLAGGWLWLRHSSLVAVERVQVSGAHGANSAAIETALAGAARQMSTLDVHPAALRAAVASFPVVRDVQATASFPHGLRIRVIEQPPVAVLVVAGVRTAVAADGVVLGSALLSSSLPEVSGSTEPGAGQRVRDGSLLAALTVLGAAPAPFARAAGRASEGPQGLTVTMRNGLLVYFGDATRPHAKWLALARVLADASSAGATYVDVRLPERSAAGFPAGTSPPNAAARTSAPSSSEQPATTEATTSALAAGLTAATGGGSSATGREAASPTAGAGSPAGSGTESTTATPAETPARTTEASPSTPSPGG